MDKDKRQKARMEQILSIEGQKDRKIDNLEEWIRIKDRKLEWNRYYLQKDRKIERQTTLFRRMDKDKRQTDRRHCIEDKARKTDRYIE